MMFSKKMEINNLNLKNKTMKAKILMAFLFTVLSATLMVSLASAAITVSFVEIDDIDTTNGVSVIAGETVPIEVFYTVNVASEGPVVVTTWIKGAKSETKVERTYNKNLLVGSLYNSKLSLTIPADLDDDEVVQNDALEIIVEVETEDDYQRDSFFVQAQREANLLELTLIEFDSSIRAGTILPVSVVVRNMGSFEADDVYVTVSIPELGVSRTAFLRDLTAVDDSEVVDASGLLDDSDCDNEGDCEDVRERKLYLTIPETALSGEYEVVVTARSDDARTTVSRTLFIMDTPVKGKVLANPISKTFSLGETISYEMILVNTGREIAIYNLVADSSDALSISLSDTLTTVPAGSSKTIKVTVQANREGTHNFAVNAISLDGGFAESALYTATVEGKSSSSNVASNNIVVLTVVLAIIFVVLLIILIVLLTRKPEKSEEFGESYY